MNNYEKKFRESYKDKDGNYVYVRWDFDERKYVRSVISPDENGVTTELIEQLDKDDHRQNLRERYDLENLDWRFAAKQQKYIQDDLELSEDPINTIAYKKIRTFEDAVKDNELLGELLMLMEKLTSEQIDLIYDLFGMMKGQTEIARETGKTQQSIYNKKAKIIKRLKKLFKEIGRE